MPETNDVEAPLLVDELDHMGKPTGRKVRSGGDTSAEPAPPGGSSNRPPLPHETAAPEPVISPLVESVAEGKGEDEEPIPDGEADDTETPDSPRTRPKKKK